MNEYDLETMIVNTNEWDKDLGMDIVRVIGGWLYYDWDYQKDERRLPGTFVPETVKKGEDK